MSEQTATVVTTKRTPSKFKAWHIAANHVEHAKAKSGMTYRTRCGLTIKSSGKPRKAHQLSPMEPCVVCRSLANGADR